MPAVPSCRQRDGVNKSKGHKAACLQPKQNAHVSFLSGHLLSFCQVLTSSSAVTGSGGTLQVSTQTPPVVAESLTQGAGHQAFGASSLWAAPSCLAPPCGSSHDLCLSSEVSQGEDGVQGAAGSDESPLQSVCLSEGPRLASALTHVSPEDYFTSRLFISHVSGLFCILA